MYIIYLTVLFLSFVCLCLKFTRISGYSLVFIWFVAFIFLGTYAYFSDDYEPYAEVVVEAYANPLANYAIEPFWVWLADYTHGDIDSYRFITFVLIAIILLFIQKAAHIEIKYFIIYYTFFCMSTHFTGIRQALNMMLCLYGILLCFNRHWIIGLICIVLSCFLHKSGIMFALLLPLCLLPVSKKVFWLYVLVSPLLYVGFYFLLNSSTTFLPLIFLQSYAEKEAEYADRHIVMRLLSTASELCRFVLIYLTIVYFHRSSDRLIILLTRCLFSLFLISVFFFLLPMDTNVIYKRLLWFGLLIMTIIWSKCIREKLVTRKYIYLLLLFLFCTGLGIVTMVGNNYTRIEVLTRLP